jgi:hypothetical protein
MIAGSLRVLLANLIDYAGLFPPAALPMEEAVRNYARYREGEHAWMLGKFVVPRASADEVPVEFPVSVLGVDEVKFEEIDRAAPGAYVEITDRALLDEIAGRGLRAKIRTGGVTHDAFPAIASVAEFLRACKAKGLAFKVTAGLHHPVRCVRPLTYEPDAARGTMHGFLNVFLAAAMLDHANEILAETDPRAFTFDDQGAWWRGHRASTMDLVEMRTFATSFGSCSFEEPIADLQELGWL